MEIWNPILSVATLADASLIHWGGTDACLMTCHDITNYVSMEETDTPKL